VKNTVFVHSPGCANQNEHQNTLSQSAAHVGGGERVNICRKTRKREGLGKVRRNSYFGKKGLHSGKNFKTLVHFRKSFQCWRDIRKQEGLNMDAEIALLHFCQIHK